MNVFKLFVISTCISFFIPGCIMNCVTGSGEVIIEDRSVKPFHSVNLQGIGKIYITQGSEHSLKIKTDDNILPQIVTKINNGKLIISSENCIIKVTLLDIYITMNEIIGLDVSGSGDILTDSKITSKNIKLIISGSGSINLDVEAKNVSSLISGSGVIKLKGVASNHKIMINGSGNVSCQDLLTKISNVEINGSGDCDINVSDVLTSKINGSGHVTYIGKPQVTTDTNGSGSVRSKK